MKQVEKKQIIKSLNGELTLRIEEKLNKLKGKNLAPEKLARANKNLSKIKSLPK